jgi:hypothetical protein
VAHKRIHNQRFADEMLKRILAVSGHPLNFLVDRAKGAWRARRVHGQDEPSFQVGHAESLHAGGPERLFVEDADSNQLANWKGECKGVIFQRTGVLIGNVHVEAGTARMWERLELLPRGTVEAAVDSQGWNPAGGN